MGRADVYSQPGAPDPVLPAELVRELVRSHLPDEVGLSGGMEVDESGGEARVYLFARSDAPAAWPSRRSGRTGSARAPAWPRRRRSSAGWPGRSPAGSLLCTGTTRPTPLKDRSSTS